MKEKEGGRSGHDSRQSFWLPFGRLVGPLGVDWSGIDVVVFVVEAEAASRGSST